MNSSTCGFLLLIGCCSFFAYYTLWVIVLPFYPPLADLFPSARYALIIPAFSGTVFIGSLILYTIWALKTQWFTLRWEPDFTILFKYSCVVSLTAEKTEMFIIIIDTYPTTKSFLHSSPLHLPSSVAVFPSLSKSSHLCVWTKETKFWSLHWHLALQGVKKSNIVC